MIGIGIIIQQLFYATTALLYEPQKRLIFGGPAAGLRDWQIGLLIGFAITCAVIATMLVVGGYRFAREMPAALVCLRRYAIWQIAIVLPNTAFVAFIAGDIARTNYQTDDASQVQVAAMVQALAAIVWSIIILFAIRMPSVLDRWKSIEAEAVLSVLRDGEQSSLAADS